MARELESDGRPPRGSKPENRGVRDGLLGRRGMLKASASLVAVAGLGVASSPVSADDHAYKTIVLSRGEQRVYEIGDGERFADVLIDQTARGSMLSLRVSEDADDWTIENVGWKGLAPTGSQRAHTFLINVRGNGRIENVFIDQRDHEGRPGSDVGGIWTYSDTHDGHIECRHNFIAGCGNNASYPSGDGWSHTAASGTVEHYRSYHRDNTVSNFRPGQEDCYVRDCVSVINDPYGTRGGYPSTGSQLSRAIWAWHHTNIYVENTAIWHDPNDVSPAEPFWATLRGGSEGSACELHVVDCDINPSWEEAGYELFPKNAGGGANGRHVRVDGLGHEPDVAVLGDGVPTTPEMAAAGERNLPPELGTEPSGGVGDFGQADGNSLDTFATDEPTTVDPKTYPYELLIEHDESGSRSVYQVEFDGDVMTGDDGQAPILIDNVVRGGVGPRADLDIVYFDGRIRTVELHEDEHTHLILVDAQSGAPLGVYRNGGWAELADGESLDVSADDGHEFSLVEDRRGMTIAGGLGSAGVSGYMLRDRRRRT